MSRLSDDAVTLRHVVRLVSSLATVENCRKAPGLAESCNKAVYWLECVRLSVAALAEAETRRDAASPSTMGGTP